MKVMDMVKTASSTVVSVGAGAIVGNIVCATMPAGTGFLMRGAIKVASYALSNAVGRFAAKQVEDEIDEVVDLVKTTIKKDEEDEEVKKD